MAKIVITHWVHPDVIQLLQPIGTVLVNPERGTLPREEIIRRTRDADALLAFMPDCVDEAFLNACPNLKIVAGAFKGGDNIDAAACARRGIRFTVIPDLLTHPTAELGVLLLLGLARHVTAADTLVRSGKFKGWQPILGGYGIAGQNLGIIGFGRLGQALARKLSGFECRIYYYDPHTSASYSAAQTAFPPPEALPLNELCTRCPLLLVAVPLAPETTHLINRARLNLMSPETLLINIGRGSVVDENAVAEALRQNRLGGYAADVFEFEDLSRPDRPATIPQNLLEQESKTLFTPHLGSMVENIRREIALHAAREILATLPPTVPQ